MYVGLVGRALERKRVASAKARAGERGPDAGQSAGGRRQSALRPASRLGADAGSEGEGPGAVPASAYGVQIAGLASYLPPRVVTNAELEARGGFPPGSLDRSRAGVTTRHFCDPPANNSDMGAEAARRALADAGVSPEELDAIINCSGTCEQVALWDSWCVASSGRGVWGVRGMRGVVW